MLNEKARAPDFNLLDQDKNMCRLSDYRGKWIVLYFYPKDGSPGCTREAANFRDNIKQFYDLNTEVIGISPDSPESHKKFINKHDLKTILLSDIKRDVIREYGAGALITKRISYLINPEGIIEKVYPKVNPSKHAQEIVKDLKEKAAGTSNLA